MQKLILLKIFCCAVFLLFSVDVSAGGKSRKKSTGSERPLSTFKKGANRFQRPSGSKSLDLRHLFKRKNNGDTFGSFNSEKNSDESDYDDYVTPTYYSPSYRHSDYEPQTTSRRQYPLDWENNFEREQDFLYVDDFQQKVGGLLRTSEEPCHVDAFSPTRPRTTQSASSLYHGDHVEPQTSWNECSGEFGITSNYSSGGCTNRKVSTALLDFMNQVMRTCATAAYKGAGLGTSDIDQVHITHDGITGDTSHSSRSYHSINRAIDVKALRLTDKEGKTVNLKYADAALTATRSGTVTPQVTFWTKFSGCWKGNVHKHLDLQSGNEGQCRYSGYVGWDNPNHRQHIHLSLPLCPRKNFYLSYLFKQNKCEKGGFV